MPSGKSSLGNEGDDELWRCLSAVFNLLLLHRRLLISIVGPIFAG